jgi:hypothetical protein
MGPVRYRRGRGGKGRVPGASSGADRLRTRWRICKPDPASSQTPLDCPALYKIHTFVCWLYMLDYRAYNALEGWVATCVPT